jgi:hypothetical protein
MRPATTNTMAIRSFALAAAMLFCIGLSDQASAQQPSLDHYQCYEIEGRQMEPLPVELVDQFGATTNRVVEAKYLCAPVDKNGEGVNDKRSHLVCYTLSAQIPQNVRVEVDNQFGTQEFIVRERQLLCVPSAKRIIEEPPNGEPPKARDNHYQCYKAEHEPIEPLPVKLADQFNPQGWEDRIIAMPFLCNPVDKNGEGIFDVERHLACYTLVRQQEPQTNRHVLVTDQFGKHELVVKQAQTLCVPSRKGFAVEPPPEPQPRVDVRGNHYTCYSVDVRGERFEPGQVALKDQFGGTEAVVAEEDSLCTPAEKNGEEIEDKEAHLLCYRLEKGAEGDWTVFASNQFGGVFLRAYAAVYLCVPAKKEVL